MLLPDLAAATDVPRAVNAANRDAAVRERARHISVRATEGISDAVNEIADLGLVKSTTVQTRVYTTSPGFKLYILNGEEAFFGFYPVVKHRVTVDGAATNTFDTMGKDAILFYFNAQDEDTYGEYVNQAGGVAPASVLRAPSRCRRRWRGGGWRWRAAGVCCRQRRCRVTTLCTASDRLCIRCQRSAI